MASTKMPVTAISLKLPTDLLERLRARATAEGTSVSAILIDGAAASDGALVRVAELEAKVASLTEALAKARKVAQSLMPMADRKPERGDGKMVAVFKMVAELMPVAGDQFPEQETWWQKKQRTNAAKAPRGG